MPPCAGDAPSRVAALADVSRTPLVRVKLPSRVPFGFHGSWAEHDVLDRAIAAKGDDR
ncbi:hypothetical protein GCM10014715_66460 [Streptomyces spiralis]|uniref:Dioxygenase n=1 Tax=Streptomyces spiralis TaxID=66376 RepID=A0A919DZB6_9ACTN|nr:hypothetical protein GCM10014715_66460 [Streptomyces spiralis]